MTTALAKKGDAAIVEQVVMLGDLAKLTAEQRVSYYMKVCDSIGLNPLTRPFDYITLNGKLTLYAKRDATDQLRKLHRVSITLAEPKLQDGLYIVTAIAKMPDGRTDSATGAVDLGMLKGDARANAVMKAETKAKRRVTLSIIGLGWLDETEVESVPGSKAAEVDMSTGEIAAPTNPATVDQFDRINDLTTNFTDEQRQSLGAWVNKTFQRSIADLDEKQAATLIAKLEKRTKAPLTT